VTSTTATLTVNTPTFPAITTQPSNQTVAVGQTATFTVVATGATPLNYQWQKNGTNISGAMSSSFRTPPTMSSDNGSTFQVVVSNSLGNVTSNPATLTVTAASSGVDVVTYHNDNARTGQNLSETTLTPSNVNSNNFGKLRFLAVDGLVDAEPLYLSNLVVAGATHNVVFVPTENGTVYAFDPDSGVQLWKHSVLQSGEIPGDDHGCGQVGPKIGVTSTPVIDRSKGPNGAIFVVTMSKNTSSGTYFHRLHALDITTGAELFGGPTTIQATFPGTGDNSSNGNVVFDATQYKERAGLLLLNGVIYTTWASHCDIRLYTGWIISYSESTLQRVSVLNIIPNGSEGSIWMSGAGPAADSSGNIYFLTANGTFDTTLDANGFPANGDYGNAFMKLSTKNNVLAVADYFNMDNTVSESGGDVDLGSGGALVLPDLTDGNGKVQHLAVGAGKDSNIYVVNRDSMGKFNSANNNSIYQELSGALPGGIWGMAAYFNGVVYYAGVGDPLVAFPITNAKLNGSPASQSGNSFGYPGATPSISANGTVNGIVWAVENGGTAVLHAYDATDLSKELYNSNQAGSRDHFAGNKFITPMIANGKVFVGTPNGVAVFGLLH
jgi:hypothetical protein